MWCAEAANIVKLASSILDSVVAVSEDGPAPDKELVEELVGELRAMIEEAEALVLSVTHRERKNRPSSLEICGLCGASSSEGCERCGV